MFGLPIDFSGLTYRTQTEVVFFKVLFLSDFGIFKKDTQVKELIFNIVDCTLKVHTGTTTICQQLKLTPLYE